MPRLSPDGRRVAVTIDPRPSSVWVYDLSRRAGIPLATGGHSLSPVWTPDGASIVYTARREMYSRLADGSSEPRLLLRRDRAQFANAWTADGRSLVFSDDTSVGLYDLWLLPTGAEPRPLVRSPAQEVNARLSPDDRWLAYASDESGRHEVYVRPFPDVASGKWLVSTGGGSHPVWAPDGRELFYVSGTTMMSVTLKTRGAAFDAGTPVALFSGPFETGSPHFDVFPDGSRFVMVEADPDAKPNRLDLVVGWTEELRRQMR
jgi:serine/threonine-protein kinase